MKVKIGAIYITVKDMDRAISFYEKVLGQKVTEKDKRMSSFVIDGGTLLLYDSKSDGEKVKFGNNVVVTFEVDDLDAIQKITTAKKCEVIMPVSDLGKYKIFQVKDLEGNLIEFYCEANDKK